MGKKVCSRNSVRYLVLLASLSVVIGLRWSSTRAGQDQVDMHFEPNPPQKLEKARRSLLRNDRPLPQSRVEAVQAGTATADQFGYSLDATIPYAWVNTMPGTQVIFSDEDDSITGTLDIGFNFPFYENTYSQLSISTNGILFFGSGSVDPDNQPAPQDTLPNNYIAPFWDDLVVGGTFNAGSVRYLTGGSAPNRYFVVAWKDITRLGSTDTLTFQVILHENGDIDFQYREMNGDLEQATVGIEDEDGVDGMVYLHNAPGLRNAQAVRFVRPPAGPRVKTLTHYQSGFTVQDSSVFQVALRNTGEVGTDTFNISIGTPDSEWSIDLRQADGVTSLKDTDLDGQLDTGPVGQGDTLTVTLVISPTETVAAGGNLDVALVASSALDDSQQVTTTISTAIPAPFAQVAADSQIGRALSYQWSENQIETLLTPEYESSSVSVVRAGADGYVTAWENRGVGGAGVFSNIEYSLVDRAGDEIRAATPIQDHSLATMSTQDHFMALATAPDGRIGVVWVRDLLNVAIFKTNSNVYFAIIAPGGALEHGPINVTMNAGWRGDSDLNIPTFLSPRIAATADNRFFLSWVDDRDQAGGQLSDVAVAVYDTMGQQVTSPAAITQGIAGSDRFLDPSMASIGNNRVFLVYSRLDPVSITYSLDFVVLDNDGAVYQAETPLAGSNGWGSDIDLVPSGNLIVTWTNPVENRIEYVVLETGSFGVVSGPLGIENPDGRPADFVSISVTDVGLAVLTWMDSAWNQRLYYASVNPEGNIVTPPMIMSSGISAGSTLITSLNGQGNAPYQTIWKAYLPAVTR